MLSIAGLLTPYTNKHPKRSVAAIHAQHCWSTYTLHQQTPQKVSSSHTCSASLIYLQSTPTTTQGQWQPYMLGIAGLLTIYTNNRPKISSSHTCSASLVYL